MAASLEQIIAATRRRVAEARRNANSRELERLAQEHSPRGFRRALKAVSQTRPAIIAELKKASPSRGLIRENFDPAVLAASRLAPDMLPFTRQILIACDAAKLGVAVPGV